MIDLEHDVIDARQVARMLGCNYATVLYLTQRGKLPHFMVGHMYRFKRSQIVQHVEDQIAESTQPKEQALA